MGKYFMVRYKYILSPWYTVTFSNVYQLVAFIDCIHSNEWFEECDVYIEDRKLDFREQEELVREYKPWMEFSDIPDNTEEVDDES